MGTSTHSGESVSRQASVTFPPYLRPRRSASAARFVEPSRVVASFQSKVGIWEPSPTMTSAAPALRHSSATAMTISGLVHSPATNRLPMEGTKGRVTMFGLMKTVSPSLTIFCAPPTASRASRVMAYRSSPRIAATRAAGFGAASSPRQPVSICGAPRTIAAPAPSLKSSRRVILYIGPAGCSTCGGQRLPWGAQCTAHLSAGQGGHPPTLRRRRAIRRVTAPPYA